MDRMTQRARPSFWLLPFVVFIVITGVTRLGLWQFAATAALTTAGVLAFKRWRGTLDGLIHRPPAGTVFFAPASQRDEDNIRQTGRLSVTADRLRWNPKGSQEPKDVRFTALARLEVEVLPSARPAFILQLVYADEHREEFTVLAPATEFTQAVKDSGLPVQQLRPETGC
jgi:hypothetical protein